MLRKELKAYLLDDMGVLVDIVDELIGYGNCLSNLDYWKNDEYFFDCNFENKLELARAICYGNYNYNDDYVKINSLGNVVSYSEDEMVEELKNNIEDIVKKLIEYHNEIAIDDEGILELFEEYSEE